MKQKPLIPPHSPEQLAALRASIAEERQVRCPIIVDQDGRIIDGHARKKIARELKVPCPEILVEVISEEERVRMEVGLNFGRRQLSREERNEMIRRLGSEEFNWSNRKIADLLGLNESTVRRSTAAKAAVDSGDTHRRSRVGRMQPVRRAKKHEIERRAQAAAELWRAGYTSVAIRETLGISHGTLMADLGRAGINGTEPREIVHGPAPTTTWRDGPPPPRRRTREPLPPPRPRADLPPAYTRSLALTLIEVFHENVTRENAPNMLANDAAEAERAKDDAWFSRTREAIRVAHADLNLLQSVLDDPEQRRWARATFGETRPDTSPQLRVV